MHKSILPPHSIVASPQAQEAALSRLRFAQGVANKENSMFMINSNINGASGPGFSIGGIPPGKKRQIFF